MINSHSFLNRITVNNFDVDMSAGLRTIGHLCFPYKDGRMEYIVCPTKMYRIKSFTYKYTLSHFSLQYHSFEEALSIMRQVTLALAIAEEV